MTALPLILIIILLYACGNYYIFSRLWDILPCHSPAAHWTFIIAALLLASSIILALALSRVLPTRAAGILYVTGTTWIFIFLYLLIALLARDAFLWIDNHLHLLPASPSRERVATLVALALVAATLAGGHACYLVKKRVEITVDTGKLNGKEITILLVSDLHLGHGTGKRELARWINLINAEHPDVVLVAGDIIDGDTRPLDRQHAWEPFHRVAAPLGIHACPGNHEYIAGIDKSLRFIHRAGIHVLRDTAVLLADAFYLVGRDDRQNPHRAPLDSLTRGLDRQRPVIVLDHQPTRLDEAIAAGIDLQLSGHTHDGQVWPVSCITRRLFEISHGHLQKGNTRFHVTSGIGIWGGKFRVGTRSEYVIIHLR
jgi:predicted MPP superfamily phosphohydrolase